MRTGQVGNSKVSIDIQGEKFSFGRQLGHLACKGRRERGGGRGWWS